MPEPKTEIEKAEAGVCDAKRKFYQSKRRLKAFERVHGQSPKGAKAADWAKLVDECNTVSAKWNACKAAATAARDAEQKAARESAA